MTVPLFVCANWAPGDTECGTVGAYSCKNCFLVNYCGAACQKSHWALHKVDCKSYLGKESWIPDWVLKNYKPAFIQGGIGQQFGGKKYLWGNIPALDVLQLGRNEGDNYAKPLRLLFAASGDLRNVAKTIAQIPSSYNQPVDVVMNDKDPDIVARNAIILLIALVVDDFDEAIDCMVHIWYSALIRKFDLESLQQRIRPLIKDVCDKIKGKPASSQLGKTWTFGQRSLRLVLERSVWESLLLYFDVPKGLTADLAYRIRTDVVLAESRKDYRDRHLLFQTRSCCIAMNRFWQDGLLLPFEYPRAGFVVPNPTFYQTADSWPLRDNADPLNGWSLREVEDTLSGPATADIYGKLFYHVRAVLKSFLARLSGLQVSFALLQVNAAELRGHVEGGAFDRIEVSNIADAGYLGIPPTIALMVPLLQPPLENAHATLIMLLMNIVDENCTDKDKMAGMTLKSPTTQRLLKYIPFNGIPPTNPYDPAMIKFTFAREIVRTYDDILDRSLKKFELAEIAHWAALKQKNTIIEKWPFRLKLRPGQIGSQKEFERLLSGGVSGKEIYLEWKRTYNHGDGINGVN